MARRRIKTKKDFGEEMVKILEDEGERIRADFRPLAEEEKVRLKDILNITTACSPRPEDSYILNRLIALADLIGDETGIDSEKWLLILGMAYERLRSQASTQ